MKEDAREPAGQAPDAAGLGAGQALLHLPIVGDIERLVRARGAMFLVTTPQGEVTPAGARELGLFYQDTRVLSLYELHIPDRCALRLSAETAQPAYNHVDLMVNDSHDE